MKLKDITRIFIVLMLVLAFPLPLWAAEGPTGGSEKNWTDSWESIQRESGKIASISARFTQSKQMKILARPLVSKGRFYFLAPDAVRWEYDSPIRSVLLMSGSGIKRYTQGSKGFVEDRSGAIQAMPVVLTEISRWSRGHFTDSAYFAATLNPGKNPQIILTPREKGIASLILRIVISLSPDRAGVILGIRIFETEGDFTLFEFSEVLLNTKFSETLFRSAELGK